MASVARAGHAGGVTSAPPSISYSITIRLEVPSGGSGVSELTTTVEQAGGLVTALDVTALRRRRAADRPDLRRVRHRPRGPDRRRRSRPLDDVDVIKVSDRTFLMHLGGVIETATKHPLRNRDDLSMIYTPGVARICLAIAANKEDARRLTVKRNSVAVVSDGSAVLGLGNIGPHAALPVMEGKAALFKGFADIDAWPIVLDTQDVDQIVETVAAIVTGLRRDQPRGHLGAALLRGRGAAARTARHPGLPRRPARHRGRGARRAAQCADGRRQGPRDGPHRAGRRGCGRHRGAQAAAARGRHRRDGVRRPGRRAHRTRGPRRVAALDRRAHQRRRPHGRRCATCCRAPTCSSGSARPT